jgi:ankyrin repeat protein
MATEFINKPIDKHGRTQLYVAARDGDIDKVNELLIFGADVNTLNDEGRPFHNNLETPLFIASTNGHLQVVERLLATPGINVNIKANDGTPLHSATRKGHVSIVQRLLTVPGIDLGTRGWESPLSTAIYLNHIEIIELLLAVIHNVDEYVANPLHWPAFRGDAKLTRRLLAAPGVNVNALGHDGPPLFIASAHGHRSVVEVLLADPRIDVNITNRNGVTPLLVAVVHDRQPVIKSLLADPRIDVNKGTWWHGTPLQKASIDGNLPVVQLLLASGKVDLEINNVGKKIIQTAISKGRDDIARAIGAVAHPWLLNRGRNLATLKKLTKGTKIGSSTGLTNMPPEILDRIGGFLSGVNGPIENQRANLRRTTGYINKPKGEGGAGSAAGAVGGAGAGAGQGGGSRRRHMRTRARRHARRKTRR